MFTLFLLVLATIVLCGCEINDIHKSYLRELKHVEEDKPANECSRADYDFFNQNVHDSIRGN